MLNASVWMSVKRQHQRHRINGHTALGSKPLNRSSGVGAVVEHWKQIMSAAGSTNARCCAQVALQAGNIHSPPAAANRISVIPNPLMASSSYKKRQWVNQLTFLFGELSSYVMGLCRDLWWRCATKGDPESETRRIPSDTHKGL